MNIIPREYYLQSRVFAIDKDLRTHLVEPSVEAASQVLRIATLPTPPNRTALQG